MLVKRTAADLGCGSFWHSFLLVLALVLFHHTDLKYENMNWYLLVVALDHKTI